MRHIRNRLKNFFGVQARVYDQERRRKKGGAKFLCSPSLDSVYEPLGTSRRYWNPQAGGYSDTAPLWEWNWNNYDGSYSVPKPTDIINPSCPVSGENSGQPTLTGGSGSDQSSKHKIHYQSQFADSPPSESKAFPHYPQRFDIGSVLRDLEVSSSCGPNGHCRRQHQRKVIEKVCLSQIGWTPAGSMSSHHSQTPSPNHPNRSPMSTPSTCSSKVPQSLVEGRPLSVISEMNATTSLQLHSNCLSIRPSSPIDFKKLGSRELCVEIITVGVDQWDLNFLVDSIVHNQQQGGVVTPGRGFFGKVIGLGRNVKRIKRGELVYGLQDYSKAGVLAERIKISEDLVCRAPRMRGPQGEFRNIDSGQIACLPMLAIPAFLITNSVCEGLPKGSKIMILNGHKGIGRMILRMINQFRSEKDLWITLQVPKTSTSNGVELDQLIYELESEGARDIIVSENLIQCLELEHECSFDVIIDTIGKNPKIHQCSKRLLHHHGLFVTTVGQEQSSKPARFKPFKNQLCFNKRSTNYKHKRLTYWCLNPIDRFDFLEKIEIREILKIVSDWVEADEDDNGGLQKLARPIIGERINFFNSIDFFLESIESSNNASIEPSDFYEDSKMIKFGTVVAISVK